MWIAKIKLDGSNALLGGFARKYKLSFSGYPVSCKLLSNKIKVYFIGNIFGKEKSKRKLIKEINSHKRMGKIEEKNGFAIGELMDSALLEPMYHHEIICLEPVIINEQGIEYWTIGSWEKKNLTRFMDIVEKKFNGELLSIFQKKLKTFSFISTQPNLTAKQKGAMELAIKNGYYKYPRKTDLIKLSKIFGCSYSTFQHHLRKAEQKLIPRNFRFNC
ncbi:MAG: helix-turn-helix domain-containing protein [Candidatus Pacearchaeota archaeon]|jgi:predicted DNA binding protein